MTIERYKGKEGVIRLLKLKKQHVAITGKKNSGKSLASKVLIDRGYHRKSFAGPIKEMLKALGVPDESLYGSNEDKDKVIPFLGVSGRYLMQTLGTEWGRNLIDENIWAKSALLNPSNPDLLVIDDLRFPNELSLLKTLGAFTIGIIRPESSIVIDEHPSEANIDSLSVDVWIVNDGSVNDLKEKIVNILDANDCP